MAMLVGPEVIAAVLSALVVAGLVLATTVRITGAAGQPGLAVSPSPRPSAAPASAVSREVIAIALDTNKVILGSIDNIQAETNGSKVDVATVRTIMQSMQVRLNFGVGTANDLLGVKETAGVARTIIATYDTLHDINKRAFDASVSNVAAYAQAADKLIGHRGDLEAIGLRLTAILAAATASPSPPPSVAPTPTPTPIPTPPPTPSLIPGSLEPFPSESVPVVVGPNIVANPGFEDGVAASWQLLVVAPAAATLSEERSDPSRGRTSALVTIVQGSESRSAIALVQGSLEIGAGRRYQVSLDVRSTAARDIRVQIESANGNTYATHIVPVTTGWSRQTFEFTALASDSTTTLRLELGGSSAPVYLDAIGVAPVE
jgi:hypothetical protein